VSPVIEFRCFVAGSWCNDKSGFVDAYGWVKADMDRSYASQPPSVNVALTQYVPESAIVMVETAKLAGQTKNRDPPGNLHSALRHCLKDGRYLVLNQVQDLEDFKFPGRMFITAGGIPHIHHYFMNVRDAEMCIPDKARWNISRLKFNRNQRMLSGSGIKFGVN